MQLVEIIEEKILEQIPDALVIISDPNRDQIHLEAIVVTDQFKDLTLVMQHRKVMNILKESFNTNHLHALKLATYTFDKWRQINGEVL